MKHHSYRGSRLTRHKTLFSVFEKVLYDHDALDVYHDRYLGGRSPKDAANGAADTKTFFTLSDLIPDAEYSVQIRAVTKYQVVQAYQ